MAQNHTESETPTCFVLWIPWCSPSGNAVSGVKAKIAEWAKCKRAWASASRSFPAAHVLLMGMTTSAPDSNPLLTESQNGLDSSLIPTKD